MWKKISGRKFQNIVISQTELAARRCPGINSEETNHGGVVL